MMDKMCEEVQNCQLISLEFCETTQLAQDENLQMLNPIMEKATRI